MTLAIVLVTAYLLGSFPTSYLVVYYLTGRDIRTLGTGNPGMMNVWDTVGVRAAAVVAFGDIGKGMAAVSIAYLVGLDDAGAILAAMAAVIGHDFSIFLRLHGGNGTAAAIGGIVALVPAAALPSAGVAVVLYPLLGSRRLAGLAGMALAPALTYWQGYPDVKLLGVLALLGVTVLKIISREGLIPERVRTRPPE